MFIIFGWKWKNSPTIVEKKWKINSYFHINSVIINLSTYQQWLDFAFINPDSIVFRSLYTNYIATAFYFITSSRTVTQYVRSRIPRRRLFFALVKLHAGFASKKKRFQNCLQLGLWVWTLFHMSSLFAALYLDRLRHGPNSSYLSRLFCFFKWETKWE